MSRDGAIEGVGRENGGISLGGWSISVRQALALRFFVHLAYEDLHFRGLRYAARVIQVRGIPVLEIFEYLWYAGA